MPLIHRPSQPDDTDIATPCDQCQGTGIMHGGGRCGCRDEDDRARARRKQMHLVRNAPERPRTRPQGRGQG
jgi:hypothetical protein